MCVSCGCGSPNENGGDSRLITLKDLDQAAQASGITREQVVQNIVNGTTPIQGQQGSSQQAPKAQPSSH